MMTLFVQQLEAMQKLKGKSGRQTVRVEHVHVNKSSQAIVGLVSAGGDKIQPKAIKNEPEVD